MIKLRHQQPSLWTGILKEDLDQLWEPWMRVADELLEDESLVDQVYEAQGRRHPQSRSRGREQTPAEVVLRILLLKHVRNWSYEVLEREVKANLVYRSFCRIGMEKVPDAKTLGKIGLALGPDVIAEMHARLVELAQEKGVVRGRKMRTDTTVVETNIHYPTRANFIHVVAQKQTLKPLLQLPERARYSLDEQRQEPDPNVTGVHVSLSPIGFSENGKQALLRADLHYYKCISSGCVLLEKKAGVWKVMQGIANGMCL